MSYFKYRVMEKVAESEDFDDGGLSTGAKVGLGAVGLGAAGLLAAGVTLPLVLGRGKGPKIPKVKWENPKTRKARQAKEERERKAQQKKQEARQKQYERERQKKSGRSSGGSSRSYSGGFGGGNPWSTWKGDLGVLGIDEQVFKGFKTKREVRTKYRQQAKKYHPDFQANSTPAEQTAANDMMKKVNSAWEKITGKGNNRSAGWYEKLAYRQRVIERLTRG